MMLKREMELHSQKDMVRSIPKYQNKRVILQWNFLIQKLIEPIYFSVDPKGAGGTEESCCKFEETFFTVLTRYKLCQVRGVKKRFAYIFNLYIL